MYSASHSSKELDQKLKPEFSKRVLFELNQELSTRTLFGKKIHMEKFGAKNMKCTKKFKVAWHELKIWKISDFLVSSGCSIFFHITTRVLDSAIEFLNQEAKELKNCGLNFKFESHREVLGHLNLASIGTEFYRFCK